MELCNIDKEGYDQIYKLLSINLCSNTTGQIMVELMCNPPNINNSNINTYNLYKKEVDNQYNSLKKRANILSNKLNKINGIECQTVEGAMYAFPTIKLPNKLINFVKNEIKPSVEPDEYYCMKLLENQGICVIPGSGFGQIDGTYHFRTTILPNEKDIQRVVEGLDTFHTHFVKKYL